MDYRYLKLGLVSFLSVLIVGIFFIYLKAKNIIPPIVRLKDFEYKQSLVQKSVSVVKILYVDDKAIVQVKDFYVYGLIKLYFPFKDFKRKKQSFVYNKNIGLKGNILPAYVDLKISNIKSVNSYEFSILQSEIKDFEKIKDKRIVKDLGTFVFVKKKNTNCGIVKIEDGKEGIVCNIKRNIHLSSNISEGMYIITPLSIERLPEDNKLEQFFKDKNLSEFRYYLKPVIISDVLMEDSTEEKIKNDFISFLKTVFKLKKFDIKSVRFEVKG